MTDKSECLKGWKTDDCRALDGMTPVQEVWNAITMLGPAALLAYYWFDPPTDAFWNKYTKACAFGIYVHLPFSLAYHLLLAGRYLSDAVDNAARKLDQSFIHVTCIFVAYGLSGSVLYTLGMMVLNARCIMQLWAPGASEKLSERMNNIRVCATLYLLPMVYRGEYWDFCCAFFWLGLAGQCAASNHIFAGWGHSLFHALLVPYCSFAIHSAADVVSLCE